MDILKDYKLDIRVAISITVHLPPDIECPDVEPYFRVILKIREYGLNNRGVSGNAGQLKTRRLYYRPEFDDLYKHPKGKKPSDIQLNNKTQVLNTIKNAIENAF